MAGHSRPGPLEVTGSTGAGEGERKGALRADLSSVWSAGRKRGAPPARRPRGRLATCPVGWQGCTTGVAPCVGCHSQETVGARGARRHSRAPRPEEHHPLECPWLLWSCSRSGSSSRLLSSSGSHCSRASLAPLIMAPVPPGMGPRCGPRPASQKWRLPSLRSPPCCERRAATSEWPHSTAQSRGVAPSIA